MRARRMRRGRKMRGRRQAGRRGRNSEDGKCGEGPCTAKAQMQRGRKMRRGGRQQQKTGPGEQTPKSAKSLSGLLDSFFAGNFAARQRKTLPAQPRKAFPAPRATAALPFWKRPAGYPWESKAFRCRLIGAASCQERGFPPAIFFCRGTAFPCFQYNRILCAFQDALHTDRRFPHSPEQTARAKPVAFAGNVCICADHAL